MSFILDALKKSESERQRQSGPGVFQPRIASPRARFPRWAVALGLLLGVNLLVLLWVMTRPEPATDAPAAPAASTTPAPPVAGAPAAAATTPAATAAGTRFNPPLIVDPTLADGSGAADGAAPAAASAPGGAAFNPNDYLPAQPGPSTSAASPPASTGATGATGATGGAPNYATREALLARGQNVPEVALSLHVYDPDPARRFVFVNGQRGRDGETLPNGLRIEQILPEGAVLSWNGNRFFAPLQ